MIGEFCPIGPSAADLVNGEEQAELERPPVSVPARLYPERCPAQPKEAGPSREAGSAAVGSCLSFRRYQAREGEIAPRQD